MSEDVFVLTPVEELREGDLVDLEGDPFADTSDEAHSILQYSLVQVEKVEQETAECTAVWFEHDAVGFPHGHQVKKLVSQEDDGTRWCAIPNCECEVDDPHEKYCGHCWMVYETIEAHVHEQSQQEKKP